MNHVICDIWLALCSMRNHALFDGCLTECYSESDIAWFVSVTCVKQLSNIAGFVTELSVTPRSVKNQAICNKL